MNKKTISNLDSLIQQEDWEVTEKNNAKIILAYGQEFPYVHPVAIHNKIYRTEQNPETRYFAMVKLHHYYWPDQIATWNYFEEERFYAHCEGWSFLSLAGGASCAKSHTAAKVCLIFWLSDPTANAAIVASTTLSSLQKRVFGYISHFLHNVKIPINFHYTKSPTPQILCNKTDEIHSISALAAGVGADESQIRNYIGRHPLKKMMLILDEAPDLSPAVLKAVSNLEAGADGKLQVWAIGNSNSKFDLHGGMSTPKGGNWNDVDYRKDIKWRTNQPNGVCLYFSPYRSPAIHETDPEKRARLEEFFITEKRIEENKIKYGENSIDFWRMTLGFWLDSTTGESTFTTKPFLENFQVKRKSLWSGLHPLRIVGGFDPAFSTAGDKAVLRLAVLGQINTGQVVLDFRDESLLFKLKMFARHKDPIDIQLADQIIQILIDHKCSLEDVTFDCTGQGRTFPELVRLRAATKGIHWQSPLKVYSSRSSGNKNNQDILVKTPTELWELLKDFIQTNQIAGLDDMAIYQLTTRMLVFNVKTRKRELENKLDYRNRMNAINPGKSTSPDEADAASLALFTAVHRQGFFKEQVKPIEQQRDFFSDKYDIMRKAEIVEQQKAQLMPLKATFTGEIGTKLKGPF